MSDVQKLVKSLADYIGELDIPRIVISERLLMVVKCLDACPNYMHMDVVLTALGKREEEDA